MYIIDFFKNLFKKNNIGTIIWLFLNLGIICAIFVYFNGTKDFLTILIGIGLGLLAYALSICIALSPIGEYILRWQNGCNEIKDPAILNRIQPIFDEVHNNAKKHNKELPENIKIYISNDKFPNAFALGRHTVCITKGLLSLSDSEIKGILGHEFGHLAHKDTDTILVISVGNLIVSIIFILWRLLFRITAIVANILIGLASHSIGAMIAGFITRVFIDTLLGIAMMLWTKLGIIICLSSSRANEYLADKYSYELGYGEYLIDALNKLDNSNGTKELWALLNSSHPDAINRINKLYDLLNQKYICQ